MRIRLMAAIPVALVMALLALGIVWAQGGGIDLQSLPGAGWWVSWQVQNVGSANAVLTVEARASDTGTGTYTKSNLDLPKDSSLTFVPGGSNDLGLPDGFIGSAVLSSDQPIVAVAQVANTQLGSLGVAGGLAGAQYQGVDGSKATTQVNFPLVKQNYFGQTTTFNVQAAGAAADVYVVYKTDKGDFRDPPGSGTRHLESNQMHVFTPSDAGVPDNAVGSAIAYSSGGNIAGVVVEHPHNPSGPAEFVLSTRGFAPDEADEKVGAPIIKNDYFGRTTGLQVQNAGTSATQVSAVFRGSDGPCAGQSYNGASVTLQPGEGYTYHPGRGNMGGFPAGCFGSAIVTASAGGKLVATVNESGGTPPKKTMYSAFGKKNATAKVALPLVKEEYFGRTTGVAIANLGDVETTVTAVYNVQGGSAVTLTPQTIPPGGSIALVQVNRNPAKYGAAAAGLFGKNTAVVVTSNNGQPIVAIAQERALDGSVDIKNYEGFNLTP